MPLATKEDLLRRLEDDAQDNVDAKALCLLAGLSGQVRLDLVSTPRTSQLNPVFGKFYYSRLKFHIMRVAAWEKPRNLHN